MQPFHLATIELHDKVESAIVLDEHVFPMSAVAPDVKGGLFELLQGWDAVYPRLRRRADELRGREGRSLHDPSLRVLAPIRYPRSVFCTVFNYYCFAREAGVTPPDKSRTSPYVCVKLPHTVIGPGESIVLPEYSRQPDWEVELAAVIGRPCRNVLARDALQYVVGYTIVNDVSCRDVIVREDWPNFASDWLVSKNFDTGTPMGPFVLPAEFIDDPQQVPLKLRLNGQLMQDGSTATMIFSLAEQIEWISRTVTLLPGDVIATGTPAGVGWKRGRFLQPGDVVECEIPGIGSMRNDVVGPLMMLPPTYGGTAFA
jgi:2-keto-4-pentenoate hydratase/2-oxohepta-3-ene-1,7-dioic acid hydratase in catechol pathway